jgi:ectoine hydroxylase-related dioxygenase (phytanoyl-CoA dioxygenase family)
LTPSTVESGAMRVIPGTHRLGPLAHRSTFDPDNILSDGHEVDWQVPAERAIDVVLQPGQASLHHGDLIHGGMPNKAGYDRVGFVMRYIRPDTVQTMAPDSAMLVRGEDQFGNYLLEPRPESDFHPAAMAALQAALERPSGFNDMAVR